MTRLEGWERQYAELTRELNEEVGSNDAQSGYLFV